MVVVEDTHLDETWYFLCDRWESDQVVASLLLRRLRIHVHVLEESPFSVIGAEACAARG